MNEILIDNAHDAHTKNIKKKLNQKIKFNKTHTRYQIKFGMVSLFGLFPNRRQIECIYAFFYFKTIAFDFKPKIKHKCSNKNHPNNYSRSCILFLFKKREFELNKK